MYRKLVGKQIDKLALLPLVKSQVFCVGDRLKMDKHKAWATTTVAPKSVGSSSPVDEVWNTLTTVLNFGILKRTPHSLLNFILGFQSK